MLLRFFRYVGIFFFPFFPSLVLSAQYLCWYIIYKRSPLEFSFVQILSQHMVVAHLGCGYNYLFWVKFRKYDEKYIWKFWWNVILLDHLFLSLILWKICIDIDKKMVIHSELIDTLFIVVHKKKLIFLHWYHHVTVLLYCWHSYVTESPFCLFFVCMNYSVHGCMYGYYFLVAAKIKPKWLNPMIITTFQISQMIVGIIVAIFAFYFYTFGNTAGTCYITKENNVAAFIMYGSYLLLFLQFFFKRYFTKPPMKNKMV